MIFWRDGKAGFVGRMKRLIKGVFDPSYSLTSTEEGMLSVLGFIDDTPQTVDGTILAAGQGVLGTITDKVAVYGIIDDSATAVDGTIDQTGQGVEGDM